LIDDLGLLFVQYSTFDVYNEHIIWLSTWLTDQGTIFPYLPTEIKHTHLCRPTQVPRARNRNLDPMKPLISSKPLVMIGALTSDLVSDQIIERMSAHSSETKQITQQQYSTTRHHNPQNNSIPPPPSPNHCDQTINPRHLR
jgi:hypothetical protein